MRSSRTQRAWATVTVAVLMLTSFVAEAGPRTHRGLSIPKGYRVSSAELGKGVHRFALVRSGVAVVNVARLKSDAPFQLRTVTARNRIAGPGYRLQRTSEMCARVRCVAAVNGDFFRSGVPVGGVVDRREPLRSSPNGRPHLIVGPSGRMQISPISVRAEFIARYPFVTPGLLPVLPPEAGEEHRIFQIRGINVPRPKNKIVMYTPRFAPRTGTKGGVELTIRFLQKGKQRPLIGRSVSGHAVSLAKGGNGRIPLDGVVLSARGKAGKSLKQLWKDIRAKRALADGWIVTDSSPRAVHSIAGSHVIVRGGRDVTPRTRDSFVTSRHPRTLVGWTQEGDILLVTIDGRQRRSRGMSLYEASALMRGLGAVHALNLDGGGSTTFVVRGKVRNVPSDTSNGRPGRERSVANALAIVPR